MKKKGFTIAEVLIAMAIVGVVSALTIPTMTASYRKQAYASALSTAVSNFETAMTTMMMKEGVDRLIDTEAWKDCNRTLTEATTNTRVDTFASHLGETLPIQKYDSGRDTGIVRYKPLDGYQANISHQGVFFRTKSGEEYIIRIAGIDTAIQNERRILNSGTNYTNFAAEVTIDVNGKSESPNMLGRDVFNFELGDDGHLYPLGSRDYCIYRGRGYQDVETLCKRNRNGEFCAAYLMSNGYKMDY